MIILNERTLYSSLISKLPTPLDDSGFSVCTQQEEREQVIRYYALIGWLPTSPV